MEDNLKCGEIICIKNKLKFLCFICGNHEEDTAIQFEEHFYSAHLLCIKNEIIPSPLRARSTSPSSLSPPPRPSSPSPPPPSPLSNDEPDEPDEPCTDHLILELGINDKNIKKEKMINGDDKLIKTIIPSEIESKETTQAIEECILDEENDIIHEENEILIENTLSLAELKKSSKPIKSYFCKHCLKQFPNAQKRWLHARDHKNHQLTCEICTKNICGPNILKDHMISNHANLMPAPVKYKYKPKIHYHYCDICSGTFRSYQNVKNHMKIHSGSKPYACELCDKRFTSNTGLLTHKRSRHQQEKPFLCSECGKSFKMLMILNLHIRLNHEKRTPHPCPMCPKILDRRKNLLAHIRRHTTDTSCQCTECGKILKSSVCLRQHKKIHLKTKTYQCPFCSKSFAQSAGRRSHIRIKHENTPAKNKKKIV